MSSKKLLSTLKKLNILNISMETQETEHFKHFQGNTQLSEDKINSRF
jgi:hypothetical protein